MLNFSKQIFWRDSTMPAELDVLAADGSNRTFCRPGLVADIVQSCSLERAAAAVDAALQCIIQMAASPDMQVPDLLPHSSERRRKSDLREALTWQLLLPGLAGEAERSRACGSPDAGVRHDP